MFQQKVLVKHVPVLSPYTGRLRITGMGVVPYNDHTSGNSTISVHIVTNLFLYLAHYNRLSKHRSRLSERKFSIFIATPFAYAQQTRQDAVMF